MGARRFVSAGVLAAMLAGLVPVASAHELEAVVDSDAASLAQQPARSPELRAAVDRAVARVAARKTFRAPDAGRGRRLAVAQGSPGSGGGSGTMIVMLLTTVAGVAGTYLLVKEMRRQNEQTQQ